MSKKNIVEKVKKDDGVYVAFENPDGHRLYKYQGAAARSIMRGKDPASFTSGRLVAFKPKEK